MLKEQVINVAKAFNIELGKKTKFELLFEIGIECNKIHTPFKVQSILFPLHFTNVYIRNWINQHKLKYLSITLEKNFTRVKLSNVFSKRTFVTKILKNGIHLILMHSDVDTFRSSYYA